jgi:hypothetical protein
MQPKLVLLILDAILGVSIIGAARVYVPEDFETIHQALYVTSTEDTVCSPRNPSRTILIFSSALNFLRVFRLI